MAVMDVMGHERMDTTRIYTYPWLRQVRDDREAQREGNVNHRIKISRDISGERSRESISVFGVELFRRVRNQEL